MMAATATVSGAAIARPHARSFHIAGFFLWLLSCAPAVPLARAQSTVVVVGAGSTVPASLYNRWAIEFAKRSSKVQMRYLAVGTSEGITEISRGAGDFAAGEAQLTETQSKEGGLVELPVVLVGIVPIYNLPDVPNDLRLSGEVLAGIFLGDVKNWNSPQIAKLNPDISLPNLPIQVFNRPAGKGSNFVFTDFLSKVSSRFRAQIGVTSSPKWPVGSFAERSADMADKVKNTAGSIGYVEYQYAAKSKISHAAVLNSAGNFVKASSQSMEAACEAVVAPRWSNFSASLTNAPGTRAFPITSFTWIYLRAASQDSIRAAAMEDLLDWIYADGQQYIFEEGFTALPAPLLAAVRKKAGTTR
jgi:phosphate transport system substrate-binding protein